MKQELSICEAGVSSLLELRLSPSREFETREAGGMAVVGVGFLSARSQEGFHSARDVELEDEDEDENNQGEASDDDNSDSEAFLSARADHSDWYNEVRAGEQYFCSVTCITIEILR